MVTQWRLGIQPLGYPIFGADKPFTWASIPLTRPVEHVSPSVAARLFPEEHRHQRVWAQASPYYLFGKRWGGCLLGGPGPLSPFAYAFLNDPEFRTYAEHLIHTEQLSSSEAVDLFAFIPRTEDERDRRYVRGVKLVQDFTAAHPNPMFDQGFDERFGRKRIPQ